MPLACGGITGRTDQASAVEFVGAVGAVLAGDGQEDMPIRVGFVEEASGLSWGVVAGGGEASSVAVDEVDMRRPAEASLVDAWCEIELVGLTSLEFHADPVGVIAGMQAGFKGLLGEQFSCCVAIGG